MSDGLLREQITLPSGIQATVREMTGREEDLLSNEKHLRSHQALDLVLGNLIEELDGKKPNQEDIANMWSADRTAVLLKSRQLTYGNLVRGDVKCANCKAEEHVEVDLAAIENRPAPAAMERVVQVGDTAVTLRALRGRDERNIAMSKSKDVFTTALLVRIAEIDGVPEVQHRPWLQNLSLRLRDQLRREAAELDFGPDTSIEFTCPSCGHDNRADVMGLAGFFFPGMAQT